MRWFRRRSRFAELVRRQLDLFVEDERAFFEELDELERAYDAAPRQDAEEAYGDYQLGLEALAERLAEVREHYARTLDPDAADEYRRAFDEAAARRFPHVAHDL